MQGVAGYAVTAALVGFQTGVQLPLAGKAGRYLPPSATWKLERPEDVLVARTRFFDTAVGSNLRTMMTEFTRLWQDPLNFVLQQEVGAYLSYDQMASFRAVMIMPQDLGLHKFTEHYAMAMPIWMPAREWAYRLQSFIPWGMVSYAGAWHSGGRGTSAGTQPGDPERLRSPPEEWEDGQAPVLAHKPWFNAQTVPYPVTPVAFWYTFSEFIAYPGVQFFESVPALIAGLTRADLFAISAAMRRYRAELWRTTRAVYAAAASRLAAAAAELERAAADASDGAEVG